MHTRFNSANLTLGSVTRELLHWQAAGLWECVRPYVRLRSQWCGPYWLVDDIDVAIAAVVQAGGVIAVPPMEIPGHGRFAIYLLGGNDHGVWQL